MARPRALEALSFAVLALVVLVELWAPRSAAAAQPVSELEPEVSVQVGTGVVALGGPVEATLSLTLPLTTPLTTPRDEAPAFPIWRSRWGDATILSASPVERRSEGALRTYRQTLRLAAYRPGTVELPPVAVGRGDEARLSPAARFEVVFSLGPEELAAGPRPPAPPRRLPPLSPWWFLALGALALLAARVLALRRRPTEPRVSLDAAGELLAGLAALERQRPDPVLFHTQLSHGVRRFVGRSLAFDAERSTTTGVARRLHQASLPAGLRNKAEDLLGQCDAVRFGARPASRRDMGRRLNAARGIAQLWPGKASEATPPEATKDHPEASR